MVIISIILGMIVTVIFLWARKSISMELTNTYKFWSVVWGVVAGMLFYNVFDSIMRALGCQ